MPLPERPMHRHNIKVVLTGPIDDLNEIWRRRLRDGLISAVSSRGFARESQRAVTINHENRPDYHVNISVTDAVADMMNTQRSEAIEAALVQAVQHATHGNVTMGEKFQRHPTPEGDLVVV